MRPRPDPCGAPVDLHDLAGCLIGQANPVARSKWTFDIDREAGQYVAQGVLKGQAEHNCQHPGSGEECRNRLFEYDADDADESENIDEPRCEISEQAPRVGFIVIREKRPAQHKIKQAFEKPGAKNPPHDSKQLTWQAQAFPRCSEEKLAERVCDGLISSDRSIGGQS